MTEAILLAALLAVSNGVSAESAPAPKPVAKKAVEKRMWMNEDVEALRAKPTITFFEPAEAAAEIPSEPAILPKEQDPAWYAEQLTLLRGEVAAIDALIAEYRGFRGETRGNYDGLVLGQDNIGITPESSIWLLENQRQQLQSRITELQDLARRNGIPPGVLRVTPAPAPAPQALPEQFSAWLG